MCMAGEEGEDRHAVGQPWTEARADKTTAAGDKGTPFIPLLRSVAALLPLLTVLVNLVIELIKLFGK